MKVWLFTTCLVDQLFPEVAWATVRVLEKAGVSVVFDERQSCCSQPAFNSGFTADARRVFRKHLDVFNNVDAVVVPSGSCTTMIRKFGPELFEAGTQERRDAEELARRTYELSEFLVDRLGVSDLGAHFEGVATFHDPCHQLRELGIREQPRQLLRKVSGLQLEEMSLADRCCGFGGTFSVKFDAVSAALGDEKLDSAGSTGAAYLVSNDVSCLMHLQGLIRRQSLPLKTLHLAEVLASGEKSP